jgi:hypothetical protein
MSRKHFNALAASIARIENDDVRNRMAHDIGEVCADCNKNFDFARWRKACGV